jgi:hypothetical protein
MTQQEIKDALLYSCAKAYSHNFMPINYIAYNEALEAIDQLADKGLVHKRTKQLAKRMEAQCRKYETAIKTNMKGENRLVLFFNFLSQEYRGAEKKLTAIRNAIRKVVKQNGFPEHYHDVMVQLYLAVLLCKQACVIHDAFFKEWLNRTTYHFARYFPDERLTDIAAIMMQIEECVTKQLNINGQFSYQDKGISRAYTDYMSYIKSEDRQGRAAAKALDLTPAVAETIKAIKDGTN